MRNDTYFLIKSFLILWVREQYHQEGLDAAIHTHNTHALSFRHCATWAHVCWAYLERPPDLNQQPCHMNLLHRTLSFIDVPSSNRCIGKLRFFKQCPSEALDLPQLFQGAAAGGNSVQFHLSSFYVGGFIVATILLWMLQTKNLVLSPPADESVGPRGLSDISSFIPPSSKRRSRSRFTLLHAVSYYNTMLLPAAPRCFWGDRSGALQPLTTESWSLLGRIMAHVTIGDHVDSICFIQ